jgi:hypothetical protein
MRSGRSEKLSTNTCVKGRTKMAGRHKKPNAGMAARQKQILRAGVVAVPLTAGLMVATSTSASADEFSQNSYGNTAQSNAYGTSQSNAYGAGQYNGYGTSQYNGGDQFNGSADSGAREKRGVLFDAGKRLLTMGLQEGLGYYTNHQGASPSEDFPNLAPHNYGPAMTPAPGDNISGPMDSVNPYSTEYMNTP